MTVNPEQRIERLRGLLALEVARIVDDLEIRRDFLVQMWSKHRDRSPFVDTVHNRWKTVGFPDLSALDVETVATVDAFFRKVDEFKLYVCYTQDMPTTMGKRYDFAVERLRAYGEAALDSLGGVPTLADDLDDPDRASLMLALVAAEKAGADDLVLEE